MGMCRDIYICYVIHHMRGHVQGLVHQQSICLNTRCVGMCRDMLRVHSVLLHVYANTPHTDTLLRLQICISVRQLYSVCRCVSGFLEITCVGMRRGMLRANNALSHVYASHDQTNLLRLYLHQHMYCTGLMLDLGMGRGMYECQYTCFNT